MEPFQTKTDAVGEMRIPAHRLDGAPTGRATGDLPRSGLRFPSQFIRALGQVKKHAAQTNAVNVAPETTHCAWRGPVTAPPSFFRLVQ
jgi:fumarate hydratase class II